MARRAFAIALLGLGLSACGPDAPLHDTVAIEGAELRLPRALVADGAVHFFTFLHQGRRVNFLVRTDGAGRVQVHLDACHACFRYKMGFFVDGTELVCRACRYRYAIEDELWDYIGACAPIAIGSSWEGDELVVERSLLERAARYF